MLAGSRSAVLGFIVGVLAGALFLAGADAADAQEMIKLTGNHPTDIVGKPTGRIAAGRMLTMTITLKVRDPAALQRLLAEQQDPSSPNYHRWLTPQEFSARFGPDPAQFKAVRDWLVAREFEIVSSSLEQRSITFRGSAGHAERVFRTEIVTYAGDSYANVTDPCIPARFAGVIGAIGGLDNVARAVPASAPSMHRVGR
jgi:subtilase family serine protease